MAISAATNTVSGNTTAQSIWTVATSGEDRRRRLKRRFNMGLNVTYMTVTKDFTTGSGTTLDISSEAVRFTTTAPLKPGCEVIVTAHWPVLFNSAVPMKCVITGKVIRADITYAVANIQKYEFRICARVSQRGGRQALGVVAAIGA